jgi:hypothetical protein
MMMTVSSHEQLESLVAALEDASLNGLSLVDFYRLGRVLFDAHFGLPSSAVKENVVLSFEAYVQKLPRTFLSDKLYDLVRAFMHVVASAQTGYLNDMAAACESICGLMVSKSIASSCPVAYSTDFTSAIALAYKLFNKEEHGDLRGAMIYTELFVLKNGLMLSLESKDPDTAMGEIMKVIEVLTSDEENTFFGDLLRAQANNDSTGTPLLDLIRQRFDNDSPQKDYLLMMIESAESVFVTDHVPLSRPTESAEGSVFARASLTKAVNAQTEIQRRTDQVKAVLPHLGFGYIEAALASYRGDVSQTVAALLEGESDPSSLPSNLQMIDKNLPGRRRENASSTAYDLDDTEARRVTKNRLLDMERKQEEEAFALTAMHDEYNDDYDDQYDGIDAGEDLAGTGGTYDDVDLDTVRVYNRIVREAEREQEFWEQSRNTNKKLPLARSSSDDLDDQGRIYRGPDKIKGGRILRPDGTVAPRERRVKTNGGVEASSKSAPAEKGPVKTGDGKIQFGGEMSKIQKRRKNDNKAKIANHNRKERAQKKNTAAGL